MRPFGNVRSIAPAGMNGLMLYFNGATIAEQNARATEFVRGIESQSPPWLFELLPSYNSLLIVFDVHLVDSHLVYQFLSTLNLTSSTQDRRSQHHSLPVWYGAPNASDFDIISAQTGLSIDTIIGLHSECTYQVFAVGFTPGFGYLGDIPEALACPRMDTPRAKVPKGAVAIADRQTAVYPSVSPGGWNLLGLCPTILTHSSQHGTNTQLDALLKVGDTVSFCSISEQDYKAYCND